MLPGHITGLEEDMPKTVVLIAETLTWVVLTQDAWHLVTDKISSPRRSQPYQQSDTIFHGRCVEVRQTMGL